MLRSKIFSKDGLESFIRKNYISWCNEKTKKTVHITEDYRSDKKILQ